jgi:hypothetical protein
MAINSSFSFNLDVYDKPRLFMDRIVSEVKIGNKEIFKLSVIEEFGPIVVYH